MPLKEELTLTSWEKWRKYRRWPWKMSIDVVTTIVCVLLVILLAAQTSSYSLNSNATFQNFFNLGNGPTTQVYDTEQFLQASNMFINNYWTLGNLSLSRFGHFHKPGTMIPVDPLLRLTRYNSTRYNGDKFNTTNSVTVYTTVYNLTRQDPLGPFTLGESETADMDLLQSTTHAEFSIVLKSLNIGPLGALPFRWNVVGSFSFVTGGGAANFRLRTSKTLMRSERGETIFGVHLGLSAFLFIWSLASLVLSVRAMIRDVRNYLLVRRLFLELPTGIIGKYTDFYSSWQSLPMHLKIRFFHFWHVWNAIGAVFIMVSSGISFVISTADTEGLDMTYNLCLGLGVFFRYR